jgi:hypothetical protein
VNAEAGLDDCSRRLHEKKLKEERRRQRFEGLYKPTKRARNSPFSNFIFDDVFFLLYLHINLLQQSLLVSNDDTSSLLSLSDGDGGGGLEGMDIMSGSASSRPT